MYRDDGALVVISPHLDDAVFGCSAVLDANPGTTVITVFAGVAEAYPGATDWDRTCGFDSSVDAMRYRREEDHRALACVGARPWQMDFLDAEYGVPVGTAELAGKLSATLDALHASRVVAPVGLFHSDHVLTREAIALAMRGRPGCRWWAYEDALYREIPGEVRRRLDELASDGVASSFAGESTGDEWPRKRKAIAHYGSQLSTLRKAHEGDYGDLMQRERYWALHLAQE